MSFEVPPGRAWAAYFVHGRGRGHGSRCRAVLGALDEVELPVRLYTGGQALDVLDPNVLPHVQPRLPLLPGPRSPLELTRRLAADLWTFSKERPRVVISDGDQAAVLAARALAIDSLVVGHDVVFQGLVQLPQLPARALWKQRLNALPMWAGGRFIAVHFLPAQSSDPRVRVARPDLPRRGPTTRDGRVVCYFRDGDRRGVARAVAACGLPVLCFGEAPRSPGVELHPFSNAAFASALESCSAVVTSAGSNVLAECVALQKPFLALYRKHDAEQQLNASLAEGAAVGVGASFDTAISHIDRFVARVRDDDFAKVDLERALPPLSSVVRESLETLLARD